MTIPELQSDIISDLTTELGSMPSFDAGVLEVVVKTAIMDVMEKRGYAAAGYQGWQIEDDIVRYYPQIKSLSKYDYLIRGADGESYHYEGGTNRTWIDRRRLYNGILPLASVIK